MNRRLPAVVLGLAVAVGSSSVHAEDRVPGQGDSIDEGIAPVMIRSDLRTSLRIFEPFDPTVTYAVNSPIVYLHRCVGTQCAVTKNTTDSRQNRSAIIFPNNNGSSGTLSAFAQGTTVFNQLLACVRSTFAPFGGLVVTDQDPGDVPHYEIMVGGSPGQLGFDNNVLGVSPGTCPGAGISNSLVFVFSDLFGNSVNEMCATAAQEVAHSWGLDHSTDASDPMSYFNFAGQRAFKNAAVTCGSDCVGGQGPNGGTCTNQVRQCNIPFCPATATQNTFAMISDLFGETTPSPPTVTINQPKLGDHVNPGFDVSSTIEDHSDIVKAELYINNELVETVTKLPFRFTAPADLAEGTHTVKVTGYDIFNTPGSSQVQVIIGEACEKPGDCPLNTDTCIGGRCVPGPGVQGGLGSPCTGPTECSSGICASTEDGAYCVEQCVLGSDQCPDGFGCLDTMTGDGNGVCYPGYEDGGGCLSAGGSSGPITVGLAFAALCLVRRRRRS